VPVANPFFGLPSSLMPGQLRGQPTVPLSTLLRPYPQYGDLTQTFMPGVDNVYKVLQLRVQRRFASGYSVVWGYNYNRESTGAFFNAPDQYANKLTMIPSSSPRHRMTLATTIDLPILPVSPICLIHERSSRRYSRVHKLAVIIVALIQSITKTPPSQTNPIGIITS